MKNLPIDWPARNIARLTLSQPTRRNALNAEMWAALPELLKALEQHEHLRALIVTGDRDSYQLVKTPI